MPVETVDQWDSAKWGELTRAIEEAKTPEEQEAAYKAADAYKLQFVPASHGVDDHE